MKEIVMVVVLISIAGCGAIQQKQAQSELSAIKMDCADFSAEPRLMPLVGKYPLKTTEITSPSITMLANRSVPNESEKAAILAYEEITQGCSTRLQSFFDRYYPGMPANLVRETSISKKLRLARLYEGSLTYGDAVREMAERLSKNQQVLTDYDAAIRQQQTAQQQAAAAQLTNTLLYLQSLNVQQQQVLQPTPFTTTNCRVFGNTVNCMTH